MLLGQSLVESGLLTIEQVQMALQLQVVRGGRIGTCLLKKGFIEVDRLALELARHTGVPAARLKHFEQATAEAISLVPAQLALKHYAIPLALGSKNTKELLIALRDPHDVAAIDELAFVAGTRVSAFVAPELLIYRYLERIYGFRPDLAFSEGQRAASTKPVKRSSSTSGAAVPITPIEVTSDIDRSKARETQTTTTSDVPPLAAAVEFIPFRDETAPWAEPPIVFDPAEERAAKNPRSIDDTRPRREAPESSPLFLQEEASVTRAGPSSIESLAEEASALVSMLRGATPDLVPRRIEERPMSPELIPHPRVDPVRERARSNPRGILNPVTIEPRTPSVTRGPLEPSPIEPSTPSPNGTPPEALGSKSAPRGETTEDILSVVISSAVESSTKKVAPTPRPALSIESALRELERATTRDEICEICIAHLRSNFGAAIVFIIKDDMALAWRGFAPLVDFSALETLAVPLTAPSPLSQAWSRRTLFRGAPKDTQDALSAQFYKALGSLEPPTEIIVSPIFVRDRAVNMVYAHAFDAGAIPDVAPLELSRLTKAVGEAFLRIIRIRKDSRITSVPSEPVPSAEPGGK